MARRIGTRRGETLIGTNGNDLILGFGGNDILRGLGGNDRIDGGAGNDKIFGGKGDDKLIGGTGVDTMSGGDGSDTMSGGTGADTLLGGAGSDTMSGGLGADILNGDDGNDTIDGGTGADTLFGGAGDDILKPGADVDIDTINGGDGLDTVDYSNATAAVTVFLSTNFSGGAAAGDTYTAVESVIGSAFGDSLIARDGGTAFGGDGIDTLNGAGGGTTTILRGGAGADFLSGSSFGQELMQLELGQGVDNITVLFRVDSDRLLIDNAEFNIGLGVTSSEIVSGVGAQVANQAFAQFLFNQTTGDLAFDSDGTGGVAAVAIANVAISGGGALLATDFYVI